MRVCSTFALGAFLFGNDAVTAQLFDPSVEDHNWPGVMPMPSLAVNIKYDGYGYESAWEWRQLVTDDTYVENVAPVAKQGGDDEAWEVLHFVAANSSLSETYTSDTFTVETNATYKLVITDTASDGFCCGTVSPIAPGWITITSTAGVVWSEDGNFGPSAEVTIRINDKGQALVWNEDDGVWEEGGDAVSCGEGSAGGYGDGPTPVPISTSTPLSTDAPEINFCREIEEGFCDHFEGDGSEDCCLSTCSAEILDLAVCFIAESLGEDCSFLPVPECPITAAMTKVSTTKQLDIGNINIQLGSFTIEDQFAQTYCPSQWAQFIGCMIRDCPNAPDVCPGLFI